MTSTPTLAPRDADDVEAAEYVLGVQDLPERQASEARIKSQPAFAARVAAWEIRLEGMNDEFAEAPAPNLLPKIEARLFPRAPRERKGVWGWLSGATVAAAVVVVSLALLAPPSTTVVAVLASSDGRLSYEIRQLGTDLQVMRVAGTAAPQGRVHELWLIAPGAAPVSLGLLDQQELIVPYPQLADGWTLAVSIEPEGGSPIGTPTGPVILSKVIGSEA